MGDFEVSRGFSRWLGVSGRFGYFVGFGPSLQGTRIQFSEKAFLPVSVFHEDQAVRMKHSWNIEPGFGHAFRIDLAGHKEQIHRPEIISSLGQDRPRVAWVEADLSAGLAEDTVNLFEGDWFPPGSRTCFKKIDPCVNHLLGR